MQIGIRNIPKKQRPT